MAYRLKIPEEIRAGSITLHSICDNGLRKRFGTSRFTNKEQWNAQLYADNHHKQVLLESLILGNVCSQFTNFFQKYILTPEQECSKTLKERFISNNSLTLQKKSVIDYLK